MEIPKFVSWAAFAPEHPSQVGEEMWAFETEQTKADSDGRFTVTMKLTKPQKQIVSLHNAHP